VLPVLNKMDLPHARPIQVATEIEDAICIPAEDAIPVSAKTGQNVEEVLEAIVAKIPPPTGDPKGHLQALIFDAVYNDYRGVVDLRARVPRHGQEGRDDPHDGHHDPLRGHGGRQADAPHDGRRGAARRRGRLTSSPTSRSCRTS
jgi:hypothetical protein